MGKSAGPRPPPAVPGPGRYSRHPCLGAADTPAIARLPATSALIGTILANGG